MDFEDRFYDLDVDVAQGQQHSRKENLEISGIPNFVKDSDLEGVAIKLLNCLITDKNNPITPSEIQACHRLHGKNNKPTIIRFICRKRARDIKDNRKSSFKINVVEFGFPRETKIFRNDNLSPYFKGIHYKCRQLIIYRPTSRESTTNADN